MFFSASLCSLALCIFTFSNTSLAQYKTTSAQKKAAAAQRKIAEEAYAKGLAFAEEKKFVEAAAAFKFGIAADPTMTELYEEIGWTYNELAQYQAAVEILQQGISAHPAAPLLYNELGFAFYKLNKSQEAITNFLQATALKPDYEQAHHSLGDAYFYLAKDYKQALEPYKKALELKPEQPNVNYNVGWILNDLERYEEAIPFLQKAIEQKVNTPAFAHQEIGFAHYKRKNNPAAIANYQKAIALKTDYALAYFGLGDVYFSNMKQYDEAAKAYELGLKYQPESADALYRLGWCLGELGQYQAALAPLQKVLTLKPDHFNAQRELGYAKYCLKNYAEAISIFKKILQENEKDSLALYYLGITYVAQGDRANATTTLNSLSFLDAKRAVTLNEMIKKNFNQ